MIAAVLLGLTLILLLRKREFLTATATIKDPNTWTDADVERVRGLSPELTKMLDDSESQRSSNLLPSDKAAAVKNFTKNMLMNILKDAWDQMYVPATSPVTPATINSYISSSPFYTGAPPSYIDPVKLLLGKYFGQSGASTAAEPTPTPSAPMPSAPMPSESSVQGTVVTSIPSLEKDYQSLKSEYDGVVEQAIGTTKKADLEPLIAKILMLNSKITEVLDKLVNALASEEAKGNADFTAKRNDFALRLSQIKKDYGDLLSDTDKVTTLRRIREFEEKKATTGLKGYLIAFGVAVSLLIVLIFYKMFQPSKNLYAANPTTANPTISPDLNI